MSVAEDGAIEAFVTSMATKTPVSTNTALRYLTHIGFREALLDAAKAYAHIEAGSNDTLRQARIDRG
jgi:hypothetical protein